MPSDWDQPSCEPSAPRGPSLVPIFPVLGFAPGSPCPHHTAYRDEHGNPARDDQGRRLTTPGGVLPEGTRLVCMVCHATGAIAQARINRLPRPKLTREGDAAPSSGDAAGSASNDRPPATPDPIKAVVWRITQRTWDSQLGQARREAARTGDSSWLEKLEAQAIEIIPEPRVDIPFTSARARGLLPR